MKTIAPINLAPTTKDLPKAKSDFGRNALILRGLKFPDLRFSCPSCGTLDVLIEWKSFDIPLKGLCLDCKKEWYHEGNI